MPGSHNRAAGARHAGGLQIQGANRAMPVLRRFFMRAHPGLGPLTMNPAKIFFALSIPDRDGRNAPIRAVLLTGARMAGGMYPYTKKGHGRHFGEILAATTSKAVSVMPP